MASPTRRNQTAPAAGLSVTSPSDTAVGDLVVVFTWERAGAGVPTHTLQAGFIEFQSINHNDGNTDGRLSVAGKIATAAGAQSYQAYTSSVGTETWTGCVTVTTGTYGLDNIPSAQVSATGTGAPDPPNVTLDSGRDWLVFAISAWHLTASQTLTPTAPTNYTLRAEVSGSATGDVALADRSLTAAASENPGAWADNQTPNGTCSVTLGIPNPPAADGGWTKRQNRSFNATAGATTAVVRIWPPLAGSLLTACIRNAAAQTVSGVADDDSNTWSSAVTQASAERASIYYAQNVAAGDTAIDVTVTFSASTTNRVLVVNEWVGAATSSVLDGTNSKNNASTTTPDSNSVTASANGHLYLGFLTSNSNVFSTTPGTGYVELFDDTTTGCQAEYDVQATAASKNATWTTSVADDSTGVLAVFKVPASGQTVSVGQVTENDTANAMAWAPKNRLVTQVVENDTSQAMTRRKTMFVTQVQENDSAQGMTARKTQSVVQAVENDTSQPITWAPKNRLVGLVQDNETAQTITPVQGGILVAVGQVQENDSAQGITWAPKNRLVAQVVEQDTAQPITVVQGGTPPGGSGDIWLIRRRRRS